MILIGLSGKKGCGKNTVANMITELLPQFKSVQVAFADPLKEEISMATGCSIDFIEKNKDNFRLILQGWGTDYRRKLFGEDYWTKKFLEKLNSISPVTSLILVTDVRFENEYNLIKELGGYVWRIDRYVGGGKDTHISEMGLDGCKCDAYIENLDSLDILKSNVQLALSNILKFYYANRNIRNT